MRKLVIVLLVVAMLLPSAGTAFADTIYIVQPGDTLSRIAQRFGVPMATIMAANGISNPNLIFSGQRLTIPGPGTGPGPAPTQPPGSGIQSIMSASGIANANLIFVGQRLTIPGAGGPPAATPVPQPTSPPPAGTQAPPTGSQIYVVQRGDTLSRIAQRFGVAMARIMSA